MRLLIKAIQHNHPVIDNIDVFIQGLYNGVVPDSNHGNSKLPVTNLNPGTTTKETKEIEKVERKIPLWFRNPQNINSKILIEFLKGIEGNQSIKKSTLEERCNSIPTFRTNYNQMKIIAQNNHAKIFEESDGIITLWSPIKAFVFKGV